jgi:hypothetical protein
MKSNIIDMIMKESQSWAHPTPAVIPEEKPKDGLTKKEIHNKLVEVGIKPTKSLDAQYLINETMGH